MAEQIPIDWNARQSVEADEPQPGQEPAPFIASDEDLSEFFFSKPEDTDAQTK